MEPDLDSIPLVNLNDEVFFRVAEYDTPFWPSENSREGRWNSNGDGATQYWSREPAGSWAEILRAHEIYTADEAKELEMRMWAARVTCGSIADLSMFGTATAANIDVNVLVSDDHRGSQELGRWFRSQGIRGVLSPSAALPGATNLTLFGPRHKIAWESRLQLASSLPATVVAVGHPWDDVLPAVRHFGTDHAGLVRYLEDGTSLDAPPRDLPSTGLR